MTIQGKNIAGLTEQQSISKIPPRLYQFLKITQFPQTTCIFPEFPISGRPVLDSNFGAMGPLGDFLGRKSAKKQKSKNRWHVQIFFFVFQTIT